MDSEKYDIVRPLGRGGMGEVYLARDARLGRDVAIKYMRGDLPDGDWQQRLSQEARLLAQLNHPNIVQIYDIFESDGVPALVMEYVDGRNLHIHLREHRTEIGERLRWLAEIAAGLAASHDQGITHCDLKAENVLIDPRGIAKVTDFGIASTGSDRATDVAALGTLADQLLKDDQAGLSPVLKDLLRRLTLSNAAKRPSSAEAADGFRLAWHEYTQDETPLPVEQVSEGSHGSLRWGIAAGLVLILFAGAFVLLNPDERPTYVAVMPTAISGGDELSQRQRRLITSTVQQSLLQGVVDSDNLALISFVESAAAGGPSEEIARILGADTLVASSLDCSGITCDLSLERLEGGTVSHRDTVTLLVDEHLESYDAVQRRWGQLFPGIGSLGAASEQIDDTQYIEYLELHQAVDQFSLPSEDILSALEQLLESAERFAPLYRLYTRVAMAMYEDMGDTGYLDRIDAVLARADRWAGETLFIQRSWFDLALRRGNYDEAHSIAQAIESKISDDALLAYLQGELHYQKYEYDEAERYYKRAMSLHPNMDYFYARARNLFFGNQLELAGEVLDELLSRYPYNTSALGLKGLMALEHGDFSVAVEAFEESLSIQANPLQRANLGTAYMMLGEYSQAREQFLISYNRDSRDSVLVLNLADAEQLAGNEARARELYATLTKRLESGDLSVDPSAAAQAYAQLGEYKAALAVLKRTRTEWENSLSYAFSSTLVYALAGQSLTAIVEMERALDNGLSPIWFDLPWFDVLCSDPGFEPALANAGGPGRCDGNPG